MLLLSATCKAFVVVEIMMFGADKVGFFLFVACIGEDIS